MCSLALVKVATDGGLILTTLSRGLILTTLSRWRKMSILRFLSLKIRKYYGELRVSVGLLLLSFTIFALYGILIPGDPIFHAVIFFWLAFLFLITLFVLLLIREKRQKEILSSLEKIEGECIYMDLIRDRICREVRNIRDLIQ